MKIKPAGRAGFTLTEVMIVVGIIALLAEIAIPYFLEARGTAAKSICINNLRQIDGAKQQWALEELRAPTATPTFEEMAAFLVHGDSTLQLNCPLDPSRSFDRSYKMNDLTLPPECKMDPTHALPY